ncbi:MAG: OmpA family protein [Acidimicrobiia bacterium]|nr:OmpA family protein [Acidimicrobiia bacterium]
MPRRHHRRPSDRPGELWPADVDAKDSRRFWPLFLLFGTLIVASLSLGLYQGGYFDVVSAGLDSIAGGNDLGAGNTGSEADGPSGDEAGDEPGVGRVQGGFDNINDGGEGGSGATAGETTNQDPDDQPNRDRLVIRIEPLEPATDGGLAPATATIRTDGKLHIEGAFRSEAEAQRFAGEAAKVFGQDAIVASYSINPAAPSPDASDVTLEKPVLFETGSATIDPEYIPFLEACGDVLKLNPNIVMSITAITDSTGDAQLNLELSQKRADAILAFYRSIDVSQEQLLATGLGESTAIADNSTAEGRQQNRRAMLELLNVISNT